MARSSGSTYWAAGTCLGLAVGFAACGSSKNNNGFQPGQGDDASVTDDGGPGSDGNMFGTDGSGGPGQNTCDAGCPMGLKCDQGVCLPQQPSCVTNTDCEDDTYCDKGSCVPYGFGGVTSDPNCKQVTAPGAFAPTVLCEFKAAPTGDPFPDYLDVQATPVVINFDKQS